MPVQYTTCVQGENQETYSMATREMKKERMFNHCISSKYSHLQIFINPELGKEDLLRLFLSSIFIFLRPPIKGRFRILSNICDRIFSWKNLFERFLEKALSKMFYVVSNKTLISCFVICFYYSIKNKIQKFTDIIFQSLIFHLLFVYSRLKK